MFVRFLTSRCEPEKLEDLRDFFVKQVFPGLRETEGCLFASLIESTAHPDEFSSLTLWDSSDHIKAYEQSDRFAALSKAGQPFVAESDDWQLQLSGDMTLEYKPVVEEPQVDSYRLCAVMDEAALKQQRAANLHLRLVRLQATDDGLVGLKQNYVEEVIPALRGVKGCRNAFLIESVASQNQLISVTLWDSREDAEAYDRGAVFQSLMNNTRDLRSAHVWQTTLTSDVASKVYTSDDEKTQFYAVVAGQGFQAD
jgi:quinol monooxygenase YgiN